MRYLLLSWRNLSERIEFVGDIASSPKDSGNGNM
jgi:hypothetical protein